MNRKQIKPTSFDKRSLKAHVPTESLRKYVKEMSAIGISQADICRVLGFGSHHLLLKYYRDEVELGVIEANHRVGMKLMEKIDKGDTIAIIWWMKNRMGWKNADGDGPGGGPPLPIKININFGTQTQQNALPSPRVTLSQAEH